MFDGPPHVCEMERLDAVMVPVAADRDKPQFHKQFQRPVQRLRANSEIIAERADGNTVLAGDDEENAVMRATEAILSKAFVRLARHALKTEVHQLKACVDRIDRFQINSVDSNAFAWFFHWNSVA